MGVAAGVVDPPVRYHKGLRERRIDWMAGYSFPNGAAVGPQVINRDVYLSSSNGILRRGLMCFAC